VIRACLAKDPEQRWQNAHDLALELRWPAQLAAAPRRRPPALDRARVRAHRGHVRQLRERIPRLVGYPVTYVDNQVRSDDWWCSCTARRRRRTVRAVPERLAAPGRRRRRWWASGRQEKRRPALGVDDHSRVLRMLLREIVNECRPRRTLLVGHSAGADQLCG
jgi:hypothetical protein